MLSLSGEVELSQFDADALIEKLARTTEAIHSEGELRDRLGASRKLIMKFGVDITGPDLHIGHAVNLWMYRLFQEAGHRMVFLVGDFTTRLGDPSTGRETVFPIAPDVMIENADSYLRQVRMIVHDDPEVFEVRRNSEWLSKLSDTALLGMSEVAERRAIYPLFQGYDSVALGADLTIVGTDQFRNESMGRMLQMKAGQAPQVIITSIVTPGTCGGPKQSKALRNYIGLLHSPREKFGLAMNLPEELIPLYLRIYTDFPLDRIDDVARDSKNDPKGMRLSLARSLVARYHGDRIAEEEERWFSATFSSCEATEEAPIVPVGVGSTVFEIVRICFTREELSNSEIRRLLRQGAIRLGNEQVSSPETVVSIPEDGLLLRMGKRGCFRLTKAI